VFQQQHIRVLPRLAAKAWVKSIQVCCGICMIQPACSMQQLSLPSAAVSTGTQHIVCLTCQIDSKPHAITGLVSS
jgi:hypothetical protein